MKGFKVGLTAAAAVAALAGCVSYFGDGAAARAVSPDGRNEIRLYLDPLACEVLRDGKTVVARSAIGMKLDGACLACDAPAPAVKTWTTGGTVPSPVYKKAQVSLAGTETLADFGTWALRLAARDDGVAYRFETKRAGEVTVDCEKCELTLPDASADCLVYRTTAWGCEESLPRLEKAGDVRTKDKEKIYLPFVYTTDGVTVAVCESDVADYPFWYLTRGADAETPSFKAAFAKDPVKTAHFGPKPGQAAWSKHVELPKGGRFVRVLETADRLVKTSGTRSFPWRCFQLADTPAQLVESDLVWALARPQAPLDFSWVKPGKVAWDWWSAFDNIGDPKGCTTKTYERFIDFAAKNGVEYVIFDEGWSDTLNIWKFHPNVDVPHLVGYAAKKGVGIILWMAWAQIYGDEEHVASHFAKLGVKGFKVDFMDRSDAKVEGFLRTFAAVCAKHRLVIDYHGVARPAGMSRAYPNVLNYEGIRGLEQMKFYGGDDMMFNDVAAVYGRLSAGPMDYTPGAMDNYPVGRYPRRGEKAGIDIYTHPGSEGTRAHQMAMMAVYEAPLQMLSDSPTNYEKNMDCFSFMAKVPVVWASAKGLGGCPASFVAVAREARDGTWYAAALNNRTARGYTLDTSFLPEGVWQAEIFRDAPDADATPTHCLHERRRLKAGEPIDLPMAPGGGFIVRFAR